MFNIYICFFPLPFHPSHRQGPMFRSRTAQTPLGYLSRQLGLAAVPTPPSAWVGGTQGDFSPDFAIQNGDISKKMVVYMIFSWDEWAF
jgi:hypothetical protein